MKDFKPTITYEDFSKLDIRTATVIKSEAVEGSEKLIKLTLDVGEGVERQILTGIKKWYSPEDFLGKQIVFLANLEPRKMMGEESQGMLLAVENSDEEKPILLVAENEVEDGSTVL